MLVKIPYETGEDKGVNLELEIPDTNLLRAFVPKEPGPVDDLTKEVAKAIENPIKGKRFSWESSRYSFSARIRSQAVKISRKANNK